MTDDSIASMLIQNAPSPAPADLAIHCRGLVKRFGKFTAVDGLDLDVPRGAFFAFIGPNGAGKSTTIAMLTGIYGADAGRIEVLGHDMRRDPLPAKARVGVVFEELALFERLTGRQYLAFCGQMYGLTLDEAEARAVELLDLTELTEKADSLVSDYSKGMRRRLAIAAAVIHAPDLLFLDEPFEGIDILAGAVIRELLKALKLQGTTLLLTTHVLEIAEKLATHAGVISRGKILASGAIAELYAAHEVTSLDELFEKLIGAPRAAGVHLSFQNQKKP
ncbi:MAG: ABC transporter ATP-binding protein [Myxococcales bacterium]|jgi:ABC-2 type transport system ATP-binding protein|nr:ABC transporter ATP-binding protein [Myxococcales bacterium]